MAGKIITFANRKGGVGKSTCCVVLAHTLQAVKGRSVVVVDVDPQGSATAMLGGDNLTEELSKRFLDTTLLGAPPKAQEPPKDFVWGQVSTLTNKPDVPIALVPCSEALWDLEAEVAKLVTGLAQRTKLRSNWRELMESLKQNYAFVLIDTPPGRSKLGDWALRAADLIITPCDVSKISVRAMRLFISQLEQEGLLDRARLVWTKHKDGAAIERAKAALDAAATKITNLFEDTPAQDTLGLASSSVLAAGLDIADARSFEAAYRGAAKTYATVFCDLVLNALPMKATP